MRTSAATAAGLVLLTFVAFLSADAVVRAEDVAGAEDNLELDLEEEDDEEREQISTSLKLDNGTQAARVRDIVSSVAAGPGRNSTPPMATASGNATRDLLVPISRDIAKIMSAEEEQQQKQQQQEEEQQTADGEKPEELPEPLELRYARPGKYRRRPYYSPPTRRSSNRRNVYPDKPPRQSRPTRRPPPSPPSDPKRAPTESECTFFSKTVCLEAADYPMEAIMRSIRNNKEMVAALLTDFKVQDTGFSEDDDLPQSSYKTNYNRYDSRFETSNEIKRKYEFSAPFENVEEGFTCPSQVKYARPQLARAASGIWKYIINTGEHTQTLRLEKCSNPHASCSFISENYRSSCMQVYNYHRLLTWDSKLGLHMDIFKVPTCCSCHVHGYTDLYPPHQTDPPLKAQESFPGADFATSDHHVGKGSSHVNKYVNQLDSAALNLFRENYGNSASDQEETQLQHSSSARRPSVARPPRPRKPSSAPRPFDKLPQQHAPNTRAPGYKGPRPYRPNRPFRRESAIPEVSDYPENASNITLNRYSQAFEPDALDPSLRLQNGGFDDEYQEQPHRRVNYNYHPIIDFFKPEAQMLKSEEPMQASASTIHVDNDSWKPIFKP